MALPTVSPLLSLGWVCLNSVFQASTSALKHWNHPSQSPIPPPCLTLACQSMSAASHDSQSTPLPDQREICGLGPAAQPAAQHGRKTTAARDDESGR